jgi:pyroglutamyl-peptidase
MFELLHGLEARGRAVPCGFMHLPYLPAQVADMLARTKAERRIEREQRADLASMDLEVMIRAARIAIEVALGPAA